MNQTHRSTVNLTLDLDTAGGVPDGISAQVIAEQAASAVRQALAQVNVHATVQGRVSSAFIVRVDPTGQAPVTVAGVAAEADRQAGR